MIEKMALQLTSFICPEAYSAKEKAKVQYGLTVLLSEGFKVVTLLAFFNLINHQKYFYFSLLILMSMRTFSGGVHVKGALNCLLLTLLMFLFTSVLSPLMPQFPGLSYLIIAAASFVIVLFRAPICTVRKPIKDNNKKLQYKFIASLSIALWTIVLFILPYTAYKNCGFSTIFIQNMQLLMVKKPLRSVIH